MGGSTAISTSRHGRARVAVLFEPGPDGAAALAQGSELADQQHAELTVVVVAPQVRGGHRCGPSPWAYNAAVLDAVTAELRQAADLLEASEQSTSLALLVEGCDPPLATWLSSRGFELVVLPARRGLLRRVNHPSSRGLRRAGCRVRVVAARELDL